MLRLSRNFTRSEFKCPCCNQSEMDPVLIDRLQVLRDLVNIPLVPVSGFRCKKHNQSLPESGKNSQHLKGKAVDIRVRHMDAAQRHRLLSAALSLGFSGIGTGKNSLHLDVREGPPKYWSY